MLFKKEKNEYNETIMNKQDTISMSKPMILYINCFGDAVQVDALRRIKN